MAESLEVAALRRLAAHIGARVTDTSTPGVHAATSYHYATGTGGIGLAIDLAEPSGPSHDTPGLLKIATQVALAIGPQCAELIYAGGPCLRNGRPYQYSSTVLAAHHNHVHVAVNRGFRFDPPKEAPVPDAAPDYALTGTPCAISAVFDSSGRVIGYYVLTDDGSIAAIGVPYLGRVHKAS